MAFSFNRSMLSRRAAVKTGVAAASASMAHWSFGAAAEPAARIITKPIPSTGERLPVIGVGTNAYGVAGAEGLAARREVLKRMPELGASVVDTAASYGRSEEVIGDIVEGCCQSNGNLSLVWRSEPKPSRTSGRKGAPLS